jgi:hypothetical protein
MLHGTVAGRDGNTPPGVPVGPAKNQLIDAAFLLRAHQKLPCKNTATGTFPFSQRPACKIAVRNIFSGCTGRAARVRIEQLKSSF